MIDDRPVVICLTVEVCPKPAERLSLQEWCSVCAAAIWVGPSTLAGVAEEFPGAAPNFVCMECAPGVMAAHECTMVLPQAQQRMLARDDPAALRFARHMVRRFNHHHG